AEGSPQGLGARAVTADIGAFEVAFERRLAEFAVARTVILLLHPRLRRGVEQRQRKYGLAFEHGHEPSLDSGPEVLLFAVLLGRARQRQVLYDAEPLDSLTGLRGL